MAAKVKIAEFLEEHEIKKLLEYLSQNEYWVYYLVVRLGVSTALRFSEMSRITWIDVLGAHTLLISGKKAGKIREIPIFHELSENLSSVYLNLGRPKMEDSIIPITIRGFNKQIKVLSMRAGIRGKRISTHTWRKTFGREVWKRNNQSENSIIKLANIFNHSSASVTKKYLGIEEEMPQSLYTIQDLFY
jgi:integrase